MTQPSPGDPSPEEARLERLMGYVARDPGNVVLLADALGLALSLRRHDDAARLAAEAERVPAPTPALQARLNLHYLTLQRFADAFRAGQAAVAGGNADANVLYNTAVAAWHLGELQEARQLLLRAYPDASGAPRHANLLMARVCHGTSDLAEGIERLSTILSLSGNGAADPEVLGLRALMASDNDDAAQALVDARASLSAMPGQRDALLALADTLLANEQYDEARDAYERLAIQDPSLGRAQGGLAQVCLARMDLDAAERHADAACRALQGHTGSWHLLGWARLLKGDTAGARNAFEQALEADRNFAETHGSLAAIDAMEGKADDARRRIRVAERLDPDGLAMQYARLLLLIQENDHAGARQLVEQVLSRPITEGGPSATQIVEQRLRELLASRTLH